VDARAPSDNASIAMAGTLTLVDIANIIQRVTICLPSYGYGCGTAMIAVLKSAGVSRLRMI
jgi:hypothetical protein